MIGNLFFSNDRLRAGAREGLQSHSNEMLNNTVLTFHEHIGRVVCILIK